MSRRYAETEAVGILRRLRSHQDIADLLDTELRRLFHQLYPLPGPYSIFTIPKKTGGTRTISAPSRQLAIWQTIIAELLRDAYRENRRPANAFRLKRGIITNARPHLRARYVLNLDLHDFFGAIHFGRVRGLFMSKPFDIPGPVASVLAQLCCSDHRLPQGAPSSPPISNWICRRLDQELLRLADSQGAAYSRYADDITFSSRRPHLSSALVESSIGNVVVLGGSVRDIIERNGFEINESKVWLRMRGARQEVTGIIVNERLNVRRRFLKSLRSALHQWDAHGYDHAEGRFLEKYNTRYRRPGAKIGLRDSLRGRLGFLAQVRGCTDAVYLRYVSQFRELESRDFKVPLVETVVFPQSASRTYNYLLKQALWVVQVFDKAGNEKSHGTGVSLSGHGIVTAFHVVEECGEEDRIVVRPGQDLSKQYDADIVAGSKDFDLAKLITPGLGSVCLAMGEDVVPDHGDEVIVAGFPFWSTSGDTAWIATAKVVQKRKRSMASYIAVSERISGGASGGPIIHKGRAVGILTESQDSPRCANAGRATRDIARLGDV